jgi:hypothetical protein
MRLGALALAVLLSACAADPAPVLTPRHQGLRAVLECPPGERPFAILENQFRARLGDALEQEKADPALAAAIVEIYNNAPPASNVEADYVVLFNHPAFPTVAVVLVGEPGCIRGSFEVPREALIVLRQRTRT